MTNKRFAHWLGSSLPYPSILKVKAKIGELLASRDPIRYIDAASIAIFAFLIGILPLVFTNLTSEEFELPKLLLVYASTLVLIILAVCRAVLSQKVLRVSSPLNLSILVFVGLFTLATAFSLDRYTSLVGFRGFYNGGLFSLLCYVVIFFLYLSHPGRIRYQRFLIGAWLGGGLLVSLWAILQYLGYDIGCLAIGQSLTAHCWSLNFQVRAGGPLGHPNYLAAYLLTCLPLAWAAILRSPQTWQRITALAIGLITYAALWFTYSRAGLIGLAVAVVIFGLAVRKKDLLNSWLVPLYLVGCLLVSLSFWQANASRWSAEETSLTEPASSFQTRELVWQSAIQVIAHHPLLGTGPETFAYSYLPYRPVALNQTIEWTTVYTRAHNEVLNLTANIGLPGLLAFLSIIIGGILCAWQIYRFPLLSRWQSDKGHSPSLLGPALLAGLLAAFTAQLFGFAVVMTSLLFWLALAMLVSPQVKLKSWTLATSGRQLTFLIATVIPVVVAIYTLQSYVRAELVYRQPTLQHSDLSQAIKDYQTAVRLNPFEATYYTSLAKASVLQAAKTVAGPAKAQLAIQADENAQIAFALNSRNPIILEGLTTVYDQLGEITSQFYASSQMIAEQEIALAPTDSRYRQNLARADVALGQTNQARLQLEKMVALRPVADNYWKLAQFEHQFGSPQQYRRAIQATLKIDPQYAKALDAAKQLDASD